MRAVRGEEAVKGKGTVRGRKGNEGCEGMESCEGKGGNVWMEGCERRLRGKRRKKRSVKGRLQGSPICLRGSQRPPVGCPGSSSACRGQQQPPQLHSWVPTQAPKKSPQERLRQL